MAGTVDFALVLNLHQPAGNLEHLLEADPWAAREILYALDRIGPLRRAAMREGVAPRAGLPALMGGEDSP